MIISNWTTYKRHHQREFPNDRKKISVSNVLAERGYTQIKSLNITNKFIDMKPKDIVNLYIKNIDDDSYVIFYVHKSATSTTDKILDIYIK